MNVLMFDRKIKIRLAGYSEFVKIKVDATKERSFVSQSSLDYWGLDCVEDYHEKREALWLDGKFRNGIAECVMPLWVDKDYCLWDPFTVDTFTVVIHLVEIVTRIVYV